MNLKAHFIVLFALLAFISCGGSSSDSSEEAQSLCPDNGNAQCPAVSEGAFLRIVLREQGKSGFCSGVAIAPNLVLTAAHCAGSAAAKVSVIVGSSEHEADMVRSNPAYKGSEETSGNDIALLWFSKAIFPAYIPLLSSNVLERGEKFIFYGYGLSKPEQKRDIEDFINTPLHQYKMEVSFLLPNLFNMIGSTFSDSEKSICYGDSGGAAVMSLGEEIGVVGIAALIVGSQCNSQGSSLFVNIQSQRNLEFIQKTAAEFGINPQLIKDRLH